MGGSPHVHYQPDIMVLHSSMTLPHSTLDDDDDVLSYRSCNPTVLCKPTSTLQVPTFLLPLPPSASPLPTSNHPFLLPYLPTFFSYSPTHCIPFPNPHPVTIFWISCLVYRPSQVYHLQHAARQCKHVFPNPTSIFFFSVMDSRSVDARLCAWCKVLHLHPFLFTFRFFLTTVMI